MSADGKKKARSRAKDPSERKGVQTTGVVSRKDGRDIALFFTGKKHAGENLADVLRRRAAGLETPIQMCDALSRNLPEELGVILAHCMAHARRRFVDVVDAFPEQCRYVIEALAKVYHNDARAKQEGMSPEDRLRFHQETSAPVMEDLYRWLVEQIEGRKVEENSGLGEAILYARKHWEKLTRFLHVPGAPLENTIVERALKKAILRRKNSLFYRTQRGAEVSDIFTSLIYTAQLAGVDAFHYLTELQRHPTDVAANPREWLPWNYRAALARLEDRRGGAPREGT
jgi:transposase